MIELQKHKELINETIRQISMTESPQRKRDLYRHLNKLKKEYKIALNYMRALKG